MKLLQKAHSTKDGLPPKAGTVLTKYKTKNDETACFIVFLTPDKVYDL